MIRLGAVWPVLTLLLICRWISAEAQEVIWANTVISYSSEYGPNAYGSEQVLGAPSVLPALERNTTAWSPKWPDKGIDSIKVGFPQTVMARQVIICETFNPGAVYEIVLEDDKGNRHILAPGNGGRNGVLSVLVEPAVPVSKLMLVLNTKKSIGYNHIDAIGLSTSTTRYVPKLPAAEEFAEVEPIQLGANVNSVYNDNHPIPSADGLTLYFTRKDHPGNYGSKNYDDIWITNKMDGHWSKAENPGTPINTVGQNHLNALVKNGRKIYCAGNVNRLKGDDRLYTSQKTDYGWAEPDEVIVQDFYNRSGNTSFHVSRDEQVMVISLVRNDSRQSKDLYVSFANEDGTWSAPQNLGSTVNTVGDEITPFIAKDGTTLYFASNGHPGLGLMDIYVAQRVDETWSRWTKPKNLGSPINSKAWEAYLSIADSSGDLFFSRHIQGKHTDIFEVINKEPIAPDTSSFKVKVVDVDSRQPVTALVAIEAGGKTIRKSGSTVGIGKLTLSKGKIIIQVSATGYFSNSWQATVDSINGKTITIPLYSLKEGVVVPLKNIFFEANNAKLKPSSYRELNNLATFLKSHNEVQIEIAGHTNDLCSSSYCKRLSTNRARAVAQYLESRGVPADQLKHKGYGKQQPIDTNETKAGRKRNQRVEVRVLHVASEDDKDAGP